jgi:ubiquitin carboxyl-terminal hydrolase 40
VPLISDLVEACKKYTGVVDPDTVFIAKYVPHNFEWKWMNPDEEIVEKRKKNKEVKFKAGEADLRKFPFMLKDGDIIGIRLESENIDGQDDFQTEEDQERKFRFSEQKEEERKIREK